MHILFVVRAKSHFIYHETTLRALLKQGHTVYALYDKQRSNNQPYVEDIALLASEYGRFVMSEAERRKGLWRLILYTLRELRSYASYLHRQDQSEYYLGRWEKYTPRWLRWTLLKTALGKDLISSPLIRSWFRAIENLTPPAGNVLRSIKHLQPDVVVVTPANLRYSEEIEYVKASKSLGIPCVVPVLSWDNLTTKGLFHVLPNIVLVWNKTHHDEAIAIHDVSSEQIIIAGSPFFDRWVDARKTLLMDRNEFCQKIGIPSDRPFCLYLGSSKNIAQDETWLVRALSIALRTHPEAGINQMNLLVRPHPANVTYYRDLESLGNVIVAPKEGALPTSAETKQDFFNAMAHCVAAIGINTSGMIDAIINDVPVITILTQEYQKTHQEAVHFKHLLQAQVLEVTRDVTECVSAIKNIWSGTDGKRQSRAQFIKDFIRPRNVDCAAGEIHARVIEMAARRMTPRQIDEELVKMGFAL